jgi:methyl-accepting chemotaxis protein
MRRTILLIIAVFLLGLISVVGVATWKLQSIRTSIAAERDGTIALYRLGGRAHHEVQALASEVGKLFAANTSAELDLTRTALTTRLDALAEVVAQMGEARFVPLLAIAAQTTDGSAGPPLQESASVLADGKAELRTAATQVIELAATRLDLRSKLATAKTELSKVARKTLDLNTVDTKAYSNLMRGVIATTSTDSPADLKFQGKAKFEEGLAKLEQAMLSDTQKADLAELKTQFVTCYEIVRQFLSTGADAEHFGHVAHQQLAALEVLVQGIEQRFDAGQQDLEGSATSTIQTTLTMAIGISVLCLALGFIVANALTKPLARTVARMSAVSTALTKGDLTARVEHAGSDEVSAMAGAINATLDQLRQAMTHIRTNVRTLSSRSTELNDISMKLDDASANASAMTSELSATAHQVSQSIQSVSAGIEEFSAGANEIAKTTGEAAVIGREAMDQAKSAERTMDDLAKASQQIGSIITVIEAITEQTKLLALNATIEAARAGDAGKGFAVVANEVKVLATKTANAAGDIRSQIDAIRRGSTSVSQAITAVATTISKVNDFQQSIAGAVEEQAATTRELARHLSQAATGGSEIASGVEEVAAGAKANSEHARTVLSTAKNLSTTTTELDGFVGRFHY